jgi:hypothetical protein
MPVIKMQIHNGNYMSSHINQLNNSINSVKKNVIQLKNSSLKSSMIDRIHTVRPGCGSCGRH